jgi:flagellar protein FlaF
MSLRAYQQAAQRSENPRDTEYRLFAQVTRALMDLKAKPRSDIRAWIDALDWNRRLWSALADDCASPSNALPEAARARIMGLNLWVNRFSSAVMRGQEDVDPLIEINRTIMQGLAERGETVGA